MCSHEQHHLNKTQTTRGAPVRLMYLNDNMHCSIPLSLAYANCRRRSTMSKTTAREYELVNATAADEIQLREEEDGVWTHMTVVPSKSKSQRRRRRTILALMSVCTSGCDCCFSWRQTEEYRQGQHLLPVLRKQRAIQTSWRHRRRSPTAGQDSITDECMHHHPRWLQCTIAKEIAFKMAQN